MLNLEQHQGIATLTMAHGKANAIDRELLIALEQELVTIRSSEARALVLTGSGSMFSAGVDLFRVLEEDTAYLEEFVTLLSRSLLELWTLPIPVIAAINGHAIAGGCILAACADQRIMATERAKIGVSELLVGVPFPVVPFEILRARVPTRHFQELVLSGKLVNPDEAVSRGLVDRTCDPEQLLGEAREAASSLARIPREVFSLSKRQIQHPILEAIASASKRFDREISSSWCDPATRQRIRDYLESTVKRR